MKRMLEAIRRHVFGHRVPAGRKLYRVKGTHFRLWDGYLDIFYLGEVDGVIHWTYHRKHAALLSYDDATRICRACDYQVETELARITVPAHDARTAARTSGSGKHRLKTKDAARSPAIGCGSV